MTLSSDNNYHLLIVGYGRTICFSYETPVALMLHGKRYIRKEYSSYSATTSKHLRKGGYDKNTDLLLDEREWDEKIEELLTNTKAMT